MKLRHQHAWWVSALAAGMTRLLGCTARVRVTGTAPAYKREVFSVWHGDIPLVTYRHRNKGAVVLISNNRDGEIISRTVQRLGYGAVRGSSTRGGMAALRQFFGMDGDASWVVTPDGPRGPRHEVKDGVLQLAAHSGWHVRPVGAAVSRAWHTRSWDKMAIPKPFARMVHHFGEPMQVPPDLTREQRKELAQQLQENMAAARARAEHELAEWTRGSR